MIDQLATKKDMRCFVRSVILWASFMLGGAAVILIAAFSVIIKYGG